MYNCPAPPALPPAHIFDVPPVFINAPPEFDKRPTGKSDSQPEIFGRPCATRLPTPSLIFYKESTTNRVRSNIFRRTVYRVTTRRVKIYMGSSPVLSMPCPCSGAY